MAVLALFLACGACWAVGLCGTTSAQVLPLLFRGLFAVGALFATAVLVIAAVRGRLGTSAMPLAGLLMLPCYAQVCIVGGVPPQLAYIAATLALGFWVIAWSAYGAARGSDRARVRARADSANPDEQMAAGGRGEAAAEAPRKEARPAMRWRYEVVVFGLCVFCFVAAGAYLDDDPKGYIPRLWLLSGVTATILLCVMAALGLRSNLRVAVSLQPLVLPAFAGGYVWSLGSPPLNLGAGVLAVAALGGWLWTLADRAAGEAWGTDHVRHHEAQKAPEKSKRGGGHTR
jgi:hypothetical protein